MNPAYAPPARNRRGGFARRYGSLLIESIPISETTTAPNGVNKFYFAVLRWHFYAGHYVAPALMELTVTGLIMRRVSSFNDLNDKCSRGLDHQP